LEASEIMDAYFVDHKAVSILFNFPGADNWRLFSFGFLTLDARKIALISEGSYVPQKLTRPDFPGRNDKDEYATFEAALKKVLSVPRSAIQSRLDAGKPARKRRKRVSSRASRDKD